MKFATSDQRYLAARKAFSAKYGPRELFSVVDHWPLYAGTANLARFMAIADLLRGTLGVPGHVAEFGSWRGANLLFLAKLLAIWDGLGSKAVHCFDSFEGLSTFTPEDRAGPEAHGEYKGSFEELTDAIALHDFDDAVEIHKGLIQDTLPASLAEQPGLAFSFVYLDTDLYEPTALVLDSVHPRLSTGGLFVLDEWNDRRWPGESLAVREFLSRFGDQYAMRHVAGTRQPTLALEKVKA